MVSEFEASRFDRGQLSLKLLNVLYVDIERVYTRRRRCHSNEGGLTRDREETRDETSGTSRERERERERERRATRRERHAAPREKEPRTRARESERERDRDARECEGLVRVLIWGHARGKESEARRLEKARKRE